MSNFQRNLYYDNKAFKEVEEFVKQNPECGYQDVTSHIRWYFTLPIENQSPWIADWIELCLSRRI